MKWLEVNEGARDGAGENACVDGAKPVPRERGPAWSAVVEVDSGDAEIGYGCLTDRAEDSESGRGVGSAEFFSLDYMKQVAI